MHAAELELTAHALERLGEVPGLRVFGPRPARIAAASSPSSSRASIAHDVSEILDRHGVAVRAGHHCAQP